MKQIKVLYFVDRMLRGGIQTFVLENMRHMDKRKIQIDYLLLDDGNHYELEDVLKNEGANIYKLKNVWLRKPQDYLYYMKSMRKFFKTHNDYDIVHLHSSSKNWLVLYYAKKYGIKVRIAHSHNIGFQTTSKMQIILANMFKPLLKINATDFLACSHDAGKWLFGRKEFIVVHNAVDLKKFEYNLQEREDIRKKYKLENSFVIGHIGRFTNQKNHKFLIQIFYEFQKKYSNAKLLLVGEGILQDEIKQMVKNLKIDNKVIFAGFHTDTEKYLSAMDVFVFPSLYEGLGLVLIEAQANGIPCFTSKDVVPKEAKVSRQLEFISLTKTPGEWAVQILNGDLQRQNVKHEIIENGYQIEDTAKFLQGYYINRVMNS